jgi:hypothetical protein
VENSGSVSHHPLCSGKEHTMRGPTRLTAYVATAALALTGTVLTMTPAQAVTHDDVGQTAGAAWLEGELTNGLIHNPNFGGFDDYGLSADTALALDAVGGHAGAVTDIGDALAANIDAYTKFGSHVFAGSLAKLAVVADLAPVTGDATSFGTRNLITELEGRVSTTAPIAGRLEDEGFTTGFDGDTANTLGQAYAVHALNAHASSKTVAARDFLLQQQCPEGSFRLNFTADKTASGQSCTDNTQRDTDATAIAILQLQGVAGTATAITNAKAWLVTAQHTDGSWGGAGPTVGSNANSTGLAAWALGDTAQSEHAAQWLRDHQATPVDACNKLTAFRGAIAYDDAARSTGRQEGITDASSDQWRRASAQAVFALEYLPVEPSAPITLAGPASFRRAGDTPLLITRGAPAGAQVCLTGLGTRLRHTSTGSDWSHTVKLPAGTANRAYVVRDANGHADKVFVKVLGRKTLDVRVSRFRNHRASLVTASIRGLQPGERASLVYKGVVKGSGVANASGRFAASFHVGRALGKKTITGFGQFHGIRRGWSACRPHQRRQPCAPARASTSSSTSTVWGAACRRGATPTARTARRSTCSRPRGSGSPTPASRATSAR